jgi:hypothetical protein
MPVKKVTSVANPAVLREIHRGDKSAVIGVRKTIDVRKHDREIP